MIKIGQIRVGNVCFEIKHDEKDESNPYKLYRKWYENGWHRSLLAKYTNLYGCTDAINDYARRMDL